MDPGATGHVEHRVDHLRPAADVLDRAPGEEGEVTRVPVAGEIVVVPAHGDTGTVDAPVTHERGAPAVTEEAQHRIRRDSTRSMRSGSAPSARSRMLRSRSGIAQAPSLRRSWRRAVTPS